MELAEGKLRLTIIMGTAVFDRDHHSDSAYFVRELEENIQAIMAISVTRKAIKSY